MLNMQFLIFLLLGLCITPATSRPSQTDDDDGEVRETEYEAGDGAEEYFQEAKEPLKIDNKRSYDDQAEETEEYSEPDPEDPAVKINREFLGDPKVSSGEVLEVDYNADPEKEANAHKIKSNTYKRTSHSEKSESTPDVTLKNKLSKSYKDQSQDKFEIKEEVIRKNEENFMQNNQYAEKMPNVNSCNENHRETELSSSAQTASGKLSNKRDTTSTFDTNDSVDKNKNRDLSRKDLEDLLRSLSMEKVNILKSLINDNDNIAKRDIAKKSNAANADKSSDKTRISVRENHEQCHSSIPSPCDTEMPHNIKIPNTIDTCNVTTSHSQLSDTDTNQDKTQSKEIKFVDDTLTDIMDLNNEKNKDTYVSDLENVANLESFYDFSEHHNNYKDNENKNADEYSEFQKAHDKLQKRDASEIKHTGASMKLLEDSFPNRYEKFNSDLDLEPLVRVKRTEIQKHLTEDLKHTCKQTEETENYNFATDKMSIGSNAYDVRSSKDEVDPTLTYDKTRGKRDDKSLASDLYSTCKTNLEHDTILGVNDKLAINKKTGLKDAVVDGLEMTELKDVNRYKRIRQTNDGTRN